MIELATFFVPATDEVYRLQTDDDADCRFFRTAVRGKPDPSRGTMQGIYVFAPSGTLLGRINSNSSTAVAMMIRDALKKWEALDASEHRLPADAELTPRHRWEYSYPEGGLVLVRTARDLDPAMDPNTTPLRAYNRDQVWFTATEARQWLPDAIEIGANDEVPAFIVERLARFHLVDNARGQTIPYAASEVDGSITTTITAIEDGRVTIELTGETLANALGPWLLGENYWKPKREDPHGMTTTLRGAATYDLGREAFVSFSMVALGMRSGRTIMNGRGSDDGTSPVGFAFEVAPADLRVAPTFINVYNADWVVHPEG